MKQSTLHFIVGLIVVTTFLGTGVYMQAHFPEAYATTEVIRYQFRASHIYVLMSGLINLVAGLYARPEFGGWARIVSIVSSFLMIVAPALLIAAFFVEPMRASDIRPLTFYGVLLLLVGVILAHLPNIQLKSIRRP